MKRIWGICVILLSLGVVAGMSVTGGFGVPAAHAGVDTLDNQRGGNLIKGYIPVQTTPTDMDLIAVGTIKEIIKSTMFKMEDGKVFSLINVRIPYLYEQQAKEYLAKNYVGKKVGVYQRDFPGLSHADAQHNPTGHVVTDENVWMQADLVLKGLAWTDSTAKNRDLVTKLYQYESLARNNKSGFWSTIDLNVRNATQLDEQINSFQVVEDVIRSVKYVNVRGIGMMLYFNFGDNPAKDFTMIMPDSMTPYFKTPDNYAFAPERWVGQRVRVRGWVKRMSGPMIEITHPEQIEFVGLEARARAKSER